MSRGLSGSRLGGMKPSLLCWFALLLLGLVVVVGCQTLPPEVQRVDNAVRAARSPSSEGGTDITENEAARIEAELPARGFDWAAALQVVVTIGGVLGLVKVMPGSMLNGPWDPKPAARS